MKNCFTIADVTSGKLNALVKNIMRQMNVEDPNEAVRLINSGTWSVVEKAPKWRIDEESGIIYLTVTSDGTTGSEWVKRLRNHKNNMNIYCDELAEDVLLSEKFQPTNSVTTKMAVLPGWLFDRKRENLFIDDIWAGAENRKLQKPNAEVGCLIREKFSNKEFEMMGIDGILIMHEPIKIDKSLKKLEIKNIYNYLFELGTEQEYPDMDYFSSRSDAQDNHCLNRHFGFAFAITQVESSK